MANSFTPIFRNPHLLTIAGNFWPRRIDIVQFPGTRTLYRIDGQTTVVAYEHHPTERERGHIVLLHGLEGSADAGYIQSFAQHALTSGFGVHRLNMRTCGGTEDLAETMYHSGLTSDTQEILKRLRLRFDLPIAVVGFSLGGNVALKLAGELGQTDLVQAVCSVSTPIDLATCVRAIDKPWNVLYARRFLDRLRTRVKRMCVLTPAKYSSAGVDDVQSIWEFDDRFTAPLFGFGTAANYYATQSASNFLDTIKTPTLVIAAQDDPLVPFKIYSHPAFRNNHALTLVAPRNGGHLGFISRQQPRFWVDHFALDWISDALAQNVAGTQVRETSSL